MPTVNCDSLRDEFDAYKADIASLRKKGKIPKEVNVLLTGLCCLLEILIAVFLEKETKKTSKNSSIPPSQTGKDETKKSPSRYRTFPRYNLIEAFEMLNSKIVCFFR